MIALALFATLCFAPTGAQAVPVSLPVALDDRSAPPSEAVLAASRAKVKQVFEADLAESRGDREKSRVFASRLIDLAAEMGDEPSDRYAVLLEAQELAEFGLDLSLVDVIVMTLDAGYHGLDVPGWKADALLRVWPDLKKEQMDLAVPLGLVLLRELLDTGDLDRAAEVLAAVKVKARKHQDEAIPKMLAELTSRLEGAQALAAAKDALLENPEARSANDLLGRYHVLELGDMEGALPLFDPSLFNYLMVFKWDRQRAVFTPIREPLWNQSITLK